MRGGGGTTVATPPRLVLGLARHVHHRRGPLTEVALCDEGKQAIKQLRKPYSVPVTASDAAEDSSRVGGSPGKQLDRRGIVTWRQK